MNNFFELGGDSILALQMVSRAAGRRGCRCRPGRFFSIRRSRSLATVVETTAVAMVPTVEAGMVPLTPIQQWFFEQNWANPHYFNQAVCLELPPKVDRGCLDRAHSAGGG